MNPSPTPRSSPSRPPAQPCGTRSGVFLAASEAADAQKAIAGARRLHGTGQIGRALTLLEAAIAHRPEDEALWVARLEILSLASLRAEFLSVVRDFVDVHPDSPRFGEVVNLWKRFPVTVS